MSDFNTHTKRENESFSCFLFEDGWSQDFEGFDETYNMMGVVSETVLVL